MSVVDFFLEAINVKLWRKLKSALFKNESLLHFYFRFSLSWKGATVFANFSRISLHRWLMIANFHGSFGHLVIRSKWSNFPAEFRPQPSVFETSDNRDNGQQKDEVLFSTIGCANGLRNIFKQCYMIPYCTWWLMSVLIISFFNFFSYCLFPGKAESEMLGNRWSLIYPMVGCCQGDFESKFVR